MQKVIHYMFNQPYSSIPATHFCTVGDDVMQYLQIGCDWFVKTFGWQYISHKPHCTPVGEVEIPRKQISTPKAPVVHKQSVETPIYGKGKWKGD